MSGKRILVVEDDPPSRWLMQELLSMQGHSIWTAGGKEEALRAYETEEPFDLLIADIVLPGAERGYELAWQLAEQQPDLRVLLISAHATMGDGLVETIPSHRVAFLEKPFDPGAFLHAVQELLS